MTTAQKTLSQQRAWNVDQVRSQFPILASRPHGQPLVYLDNGATTQKPRSVIEAESRFYEQTNANIHRGVYALSQQATGAYENAREKVRGFIGAKEAAEVIFTRGTTESINLVAAAWGRANLCAGDVVVVSWLEHHSNIVPWQMVCAATGAEFKVIPINEAGELELGALDAFLATGRVKMVSVNHVSNSLGTINPVKEIITRAHAAGALVLIDGAQWVAHGQTDVAALDADFYAFSGHKMMGPTGIGILYGKRKILEAMPPWQGGGDMIESVHFAKTTYAGLPNKFEAGTPNIAGAVGLGAAVDFLTALDLKRSGAYERELLAYATERLSEVPGLRIIGTAPLERKASVISFVLDRWSTLDVGVRLDRDNICVRTGHHCCMPVMERFGIASTVRASVAFYNTREEIDRLVEALQALAREKTSETRPSAGVSATVEKHAGTSAVIYPGPSARSVRAAAETLAGEFELIGASGIGDPREAKGDYVLELGRKLPATFELLQQVTQRVPGCMSQVYLVGRENPQKAGVFEFVADADAEIVRGLIALLQRLYSGQPAAEVAGFDVEGFFGRIGLDQFITSQRRNGLAGMVAKIREAATRISEAGGAT